MTSAISNSHGSALLATLLVGALTAAFIVTYQNLTTTYVKASVHRMNSGRALSYAESGVAQELDYLRSPASADLVPGTSSSTVTIFPDGTGHVDVTATRDIDDASLVDVVATGYFLLNQGAFIDPLTQKPASRAVIDDKLQVRSVGDFFAVVPTQLQIAYGSNLQNASIYSRNLVFAAANATSTGGPTQIGSAYYLNSAQVPPNTVTFTNAPYDAQQLTAEPNLVILDNTLSSLYQSWAGSDILTTNQTYNSLGSPANSYNVYFASGDITLGQGGSDLQVNGTFLIYCKGTIYINGNINPASGHWLGLMAEGDIVINNAGVGFPSNTILTGTFITAGSIHATANSSYAGTGVATSLNFTGGFQAQQGANLSPGWATRTYAYNRPPKILPLPYLLLTEEQKVVSGKYTQ